MVIGPIILHAPLEIKTRKGGSGGVGGLCMFNVCLRLFDRGGEEMALTFINFFGGAKKKRERESRERGRQKEVCASVR